MTRRHLALVPLVAALLAATVGCGGDKPASKEDTPLRTSGCAAQNANQSGKPLNENELNVVADEIHPKAQSDFADVYAGVEVSPDATRVLVYRKPSSAFDEWIKKSFAPQCVEMVNAAHSAAELTALLTKVNEDIGYWAERGINITATGAKPDGSGVIVGVADQVERARQEMVARYGADIELVIEQTDQT